MQELEVTWLRATLVWWSMLWRVVLVSILVGSLFGIFLSIAGAALGLGDNMQGISQVAGTLLGIPIGIWAMKVVLTKEYADFRVALLPSSEALLDMQEKSQPLE